MAIAKIPHHKPITIGHFTLTATGMEVKGRPSFGEYEGVGDFIKRAHQASGWWLADWLRYGESRTDWKQQLSQAQDVTGLSEKRLKNIRAVGAIEPSRRRDDVEFGLHEELTGLEPSEQTEWLEKCAVEGWDRRELRLELRASRRRAVIQGQAILEGQHRVLMVDYPWTYNDRPPSGSGAQQHYSGLSIEEGMKLPIAVHATPNAAMGFWITAPLLFNCGDPDQPLVPDVLRLLEAWGGWVPKSQIIWDKSTHGWGNYVSVQHEIFIIATRGSCTPDRPTPMIPSVYREKPDPTHSKKPEWFRKTLERLWDGPYLELFGREPREGWTVFGNDAALWHRDVERTA